MIKYLSVKLILISFFFCITIGFLLYSKIPQQPLFNPEGINELFEPELIKLNSTESFFKYLDHSYNQKYGNIMDTVNYVEEMNDLVKKRFFYGTANYTFKENWIANLTARICWSHISAKVNPEEILTGYNGLCSQQTIVFMELLKMKGINVRTVGLGLEEGPGHFLCEVNYNKGWHLFDVTKEPDWSKISNKHQSLEYFLANKDTLSKIYEGRMKRPELEKIISKVKYGNVNEFPAKRMILFQNACKIAGYILPILFMFLFILERRKIKQAAESINVKKQ